MASRLRAIEPLLVFAAILALLLGLSRDLGLTWDESLYFRFSDSVARWFRNGADLSRSAVDQAWAYDTFRNPHPPFLKVLDAAGAAASAGLLPFPLDYRLAHLAYVSACLALVYGLLRSACSPGAALAALAFVAFPPRVLGDLLLANTDGPMAVSWLAAAVVAWRIAEEPRPRYGLWAVLALVCATAAATKFTGLLVALPVAAYFVVRRKWRDLPAVVVALIAALVLTVTVSPDKWPHPLTAIRDYLVYPFQRSAIPMATTYLGRVYPFYLPWHYFLVMSLVTFPLAAWLCLPGLVMCPPGWRSLAQALGLAVAFWLIVVHLPATPRHDGVRQFVAVYPLAGLLAWIGMLGYRDRLIEERPRLQGWASAALLLAVPVALALPAWSAHPHELSYYNGLIGGIGGAEELGMEITYYFDAIDAGTLAALDRHVEAGQTLGMSPYWPDVFQSYRDHGRLRGNFRVVPPGEPCQWLLVYRRRHFFDDAAYLELTPVHEVRYEGVSLLKLVKQGG